MRRTSSRIPCTHHLASSKPPKSGRKDAAGAQRPLLGDPRSVTPALWPPCSPPIPPLRATLAAPRRGSPTPRARRAPGPTECSSRPRSSGPLAGPRRRALGRWSRGRRAEAGLAVTRRGRGSGQSVWGLTRPRSPRLRAILRRPPWEQSCVDPARVYTPLTPRRSPRRPGVGFD